MHKWDKTVLTVMMEWDYCKRERGESGGKQAFVENLEKLVTRIEPFWFDDYIDLKAQLQIELIKKADEVKPDLIFFNTFTDQFTTETLDYLKDRYTTCAWFGDDQWRFENYTSIYAPHYTFSTTTDPWSISKYRRLGIEPILTQWAAQPFSDTLGPLSQEEAYEYDVSFVGGFNPYRHWFISYLRKQDIQVTCFGAGWPNGRISFAEMEQIFRKSRINLNLSNSVSHDVRFILGGVKNVINYLRSNKRVEQMKARNFEIPLAGGFQLANYVAGLERYFKICEELGIYALPEDCAQMIKYYLDNENIREKVCILGHQRAVSEHTYFHRIKNILKEIWF